MKTTLFEFLLLGFGLLCLLLVNAALVACEAALIKLRYSSAEVAAKLEPVRRRKRLAYLINHADTTAPVIRFGIVAATVGLGGVIFPLLSLGLMQIPLLDIGPGRTIAAILGFVIAVTLIRLLGFTMPRALALSRPARALRWASWVAIAVVAVVQPWFRFLRRLTARLFTAVNLPFELDMNVLDVEVQIRALAGNRLPRSSPYLREVLSNTLRLSSLEVSDILLPRNQVQYLDADLPLADNLARARRARHTRFPLCHGSLDRCIGIIHIKDVFLAAGAARESQTAQGNHATQAGQAGAGTADTSPHTTESEAAFHARLQRAGLAHIDLMQLYRKLVVLRANTPVEEALQQLLRHKVHMALVRDDFGGALGVITLDSILEEIVGDIVDEFDTPEDSPIAPLGDNKYRVDGLTPIHDLEDTLQITIDSEEVSTFGGLVSEHLGRIPEAGEVIELPHLSMTVTADKVNERRLISAFVEITPAEDADDSAGTGDT